MSSQVRRPFVRVNLVHRLLKMLYNFQDIMEVRELSSFSDRNFYILGRRCESCCSESQNNIAEYVLKVLNSVDSVAGDFIDAENNAMMFLRSRGFPCPLLVRVSDTTSQLKALVQIPLLDDHDAKLVQDNTVKNRSSPNTENCILRLMSFLPGVTASSQKLSEKDLFYVGQFVGQLSLTLQEFGSSCLCQKTDRFNIENLPALTHYIASVEGEENKSLVREVLDLFAKHVTPKFQFLRLGTLHNDVSDSNLLVDTSDGHFKITGLVDFGDMRYSFLLSELANTLASFLSEDHGLLDSGYILAGYQSIFPLPDLELDLLYYFVAARLCQVFLITSDHIATTENPKNEYLEKLLVEYRAHLKVWCAYSKDDVEEAWRGVFTRLQK